MPDILKGEFEKNELGHKNISEGAMTGGSENFSNGVVEASFIYEEGTIGIIPKMLSDNVYSEFLINNIISIDDEGNEYSTEALLTVNINRSYEDYNQEQVLIPALKKGSSYLLKVIIKNNNYVFYLKEDELEEKKLLSTEINLVSKGYLGIYSSVGNTFISAVQLTEESIDGLVLENSVLEARKDNEGRRFTLLRSSKALPEELNKDSLTEYSHIKIPLPFIEKEDLELLYVSFDYQGSGKLLIEDVSKESLRTINLEDSLDFERVNLTPFYNNDNILYFFTENEFKLRDVQVEKEDFYNYVDVLNEGNTREDSLVTFPSKENINVNEGTLSMYIQSHKTESNKKLVLFEASNEFKVYWSEGSFVFKYKDSEVSIEKPLSEEFINLSIIWSLGSIEIGINEDFEKADKVNSLIPIIDSTLKIGCSEEEGYSLFEGVIDELVILNNDIAKEEIIKYQENQNMSESNATILNATFNYTIGGFNSSIVEATPIPNYGSPILVEKENGKALRKVSFFDFVTGEYRNHNEEDVLYKKIPYTVIKEDNVYYEDKRPDYIEISYRAEEIEQESFDIKMMGSKGEIVGEPYELVGNRLYFELTPEQKDYYENKEFTVVYQLKDSYTVDFNIGVADSFRVAIGKHDGEEYKIVYEGNRHSEEKLLVMTELNPMFSRNTTGFLYVSNNVEEVSYFRSKLSELDANANGVDKILVTIEPLDSYGNFISHCNLEVTAEKGKIIPVVSKNAYYMKENAGAFMYEYLTPTIYAKDVNLLNVEDTINYLDKETGIGSEMKVNLITLREETYFITKQDTLYDIALKTGVSIQDIAAMNNMTVEEAEIYIIKNRNKDIKIPINYSSKELAKNLIEVNKNEKIGYIAEFIYSKINQKVETAFDKKLDLTEDGYITMNDILFLIENKDSNKVNDLYYELKGIVNN